MGPPLFFTVLFLIVAVPLGAKTPWGREIWQAVSLFSEWADKKKRRWPIFLVSMAVPTMLVIMPVVGAMLWLTPFTGGEGSWICASPAGSPGRQHATYTQSGFATDNTWLAWPESHEDMDTACQSLYGPDSHAVHTHMGLWWGHPAPHWYEAARDVYLAEYYRSKEKETDSPTDNRN